MKFLKYKGIVFADWEQMSKGAYWAKICQECAEKYSDLVRDVIDDGETARGCCFVDGCFNDCENNEKKHYYIDFNTEFVTFEGFGEDED